MEMAWLQCGSREFMWAAYDIGHINVNCKIKVSQNTKRNYVKICGDRPSCLGLESECSRFASQLALARL